jgi:hypothetical protein
MAFAQRLPAVIRYVFRISHQEHLLTKSFKMSDCRKDHGSSFKANNPGGALLPSINDPSLADVLSISLLDPRKSDFSMALKVESRGMNLHIDFNSMTYN